MRILTAHLFPGLHRQLITLLDGLGAADWTRPTVAGAWRVRDIAAHLLDVQFRRLSAHRDGHRANPPTRPLDRPADLVAFLNELNRTWVTAFQPVSPRLLVDLLSLVGPQLAEFVATVDPDGPGLYPVAWAGETSSPAWFDLGRDYTELWHHQAQIRLAVGAEALESREWLHPVFALAARGLPWALRHHPRPEGSVVQLEIEGEAGGTWSVVANRTGWTLTDGLTTASPSTAVGRADSSPGPNDRRAERPADPVPVATVHLPASVAWQVFFNARDLEAARAAARIDGDPDLADAVLRLRSVMV